MRALRFVWLVWLVADLLVIVTVLQRELTLVLLRLWSIRAVSELEKIDGGSLILSLLHLIHFMYDWL